MRPLDFRSDTITQPTDAMREAMARAPVGDDVFGEDPTLNALESAAAELMGMEAAMFLPTGTMANQVAIWTHTGRRGQVILEENCHIAIYEGGAASLLSNVTLRTMRTARGIFTPDDMMPHWTPDDPHFVPTTLVAIENTHNWAGGRIWTPEQVRAVVVAAHQRKVPVHIDGARIFNAAVALDCAPADLIQGADSVMFCLSKGLSAPVGSILCGGKEFIDHARHARKTMGGGMRQAGHLAAAGLEALQMVNRLAEDHANAKRLAAALERVPKIRVLSDAVETNMVLIDVSETGMMGEDFCTLLEEIGVHILPRDMGATVRFVTHRGVGPSDVDEAVARLVELLSD